MGDIRFPVREQWRLKESCVRSSYEHTNSDESISHAVMTITVFKTETVILLAVTMILVTTITTTTTIIIITITILLLYTILYFSQVQVGIDFSNLELYHIHWSQ
jgi:hypothetical protein